MKHVMVCGDWHGNGQWAIKKVNEAARLGLDHIVQVGDFGLWDHYENGVKYLDMLNEACRRTGVKVYWLDGNHENHDRLDWYVQNNPKNYTGHVYIRSHIFYSPRGNTWKWEGKTFMTVGGAVSIDRQRRTPGLSWWVQEKLSVKDVMGITTQADYLFTHDCPTNAPFRGLFDDPESHMHRQIMNDVGRTVQPKVWIHGHMHDKYVYEFQHQKGYSKVFGLEMDGEAFNSVVLNIATGEIIQSNLFEKES